MCFEGHSRTVTRCLYLNSYVVATASRDGTIRCWDVQVGLAACIDLAVGSVGWSRSAGLPPCCTHSTCSRQRLSILPTPSLP